MKRNDVVTVYWTSVNYPFQCFEPDPAFHDFNKMLLSPTCEDQSFSSTSVKYCPAVTDHLKNVFRIRSPIPYSISWDGKNNFNTNHGSQELFDNLVLVRNSKAGLLSLSLCRYVFFTEEPELILEQRHANYSQTAFNKNISVIEGSFDVGKWFRSLDFAFLINKPDCFLELNSGDALYYVKFHTYKKIKFVKFLFNAEIREIFNSISNIKSYINPCPLKDDTSLSFVYSKLERYYQVFQRSMYKKHILKLIKQNILD